MSARAGGEPGALCAPAGHDTPVAQSARSAAADEPPYMQVTWTDRETGARGHVVIDVLIGGLAAGGIRMRPGCSVQEVADLARAMTRKDAIAYRPGSRHLPVGGGKGGIDFDPLDERAPGVLERFMAAMRPLLTSCWAAGEDMGVRQDDLDQIAVRLGMRSTVDAALARLPDGPEAGLARIAAGFALTDRGIALAELIGGFGVARAAIAALREMGRDPEGATAVVQGFGSMGGATARYLADAGLRVIGIADVDGLVHNAGGLDVERLLARRDRFGRLDRTALDAGDELLDRESWRTLHADVLVPAAASYAIDEQTAQRLDVSVVVEAANVATAPEAEQLLAARGTPVVCDFIANLATNAWWWWILEGEIQLTCEAAFERTDELMRELVGEAFERTEPGRPLRAAGHAMARERMCAAIAYAPGEASQASGAAAS
ncbi:MAG TPA: Glu/Leu/Phe/Val dehydrogenase dimerization domain-containing protein [Solirubrobacteraceae bacterium]|nr:Glu/Leu/Phe/Val dehydrogenase dimerization domain-containing protein [Solirubrobacteraceae bacterium]